MATTLPASGWAVTPWGPTVPRLFTLNASATITAGQVLAISGSGTVAPAGAASSAVAGVALDDCANGAPCTFLTCGPVMTGTASGGITAGAQVCTAASGAVQTIGANTAFTVLGVAVDTVSNGQSVRWVMCS